LGCVDLSGEDTGERHESNRLGLERGLVDWLEGRLSLSCARQRESCHAPQCSARYKSDSRDFKFGFHMRRNYSAILITPRCSQPKLLGHFYFFDSDFLWIPIYKLRRNIRQNSHKNLLPCGIGIRFTSRWRRRAAAPLKSTKTAWGQAVSRISPRVRQKYPALRY
jgi:hypothetical protein